MEFNLSKNRIKQIIREEKQRILKEQNALETVRSEIQRVSEDGSEGKSLVGDVFAELLQEYDEEKAESAVNTLQQAQEQYRSTLEELEDLLR